MSHFAWATVLIVVIFAIEESSRRQWQAATDEIHRLQVATKKVETDIRKQTRLLQSQQEDGQTESNESTIPWIPQTATKILQSLKPVMLENVPEADAENTVEGETPHRPSFPTQDTEPRPTFASDQVGRQMTAISRSDGPCR